MPVENTFWQKNKYQFQHTSTEKSKKVKKLRMLEAATDKRSVKIDILNDQTP